MLLWYKFVILNIATQYYANTFQSNLYFARLTLVDGTIKWHIMLNFCIALVRHLFLKSSFHPCTPGMFVIFPNMNCSLIGQNHIARARACLCVCVCVCVFVFVFVCVLCDCVNVFMSVFSSVYDLLVCVLHFILAIFILGIFLISLLISSCIYLFHLSSRIFRFSCSD